MNVVVYLRTRPGEPEASEVALAEQHRAVEAWLAEHQATAVAEFVEAEGNTKARPQLGQALAASRRHDAAMLVAMTDAIGSGPRFGPFYGGISGRRCFDITHAPPPPREPEAPEPAGARPPPEPMPIPDGAPDRLCLYFDPSGFPKLPVYLCNPGPGPGPITDVVVTSVGTSSHWTRTVKVGKGDEAREVEVPIETSTTRKTFDVLAPGTCIRTDTYDLFFDGDCITLYEVAWTDQDGTSCQGRAAIGTGGPKARWVLLDSG